MGKADTEARGSRRDGILIAVFLLLVAAFCGLFASFGLRRLAHDLYVLALWPAAQCRVLSCGFNDAAGEAEGELPRVVAMLADKRTVRGWDGWRDPNGTIVIGGQCGDFPVGRRTTCWLEPGRPGRAAFVRWAGPHSTATLIAALLALGLLALAVRISFVRDERPPVVLGPGQTLAWQLRPDLRRRTQMIVASVIALVTNLLAWLPLAMALLERAWKPLVVLPFTGGFGLAMLWWAVRTVRASRGLANARVEVDAFRVRPGAAVDVKVIQRGPAQLESLRVRLLCERTVHHSTRTGLSRPEHRDDTTALFEAELALHEPVTIDAGEPLTLALRAQVPPDARPTRDVSPEVHWYVAVDATRPGRAAASQRFEIEVEAPS